MANVGSKLEYLALTKIGESIIVETEKEDVQLEVEIFKIIIVYYVLGGHPSFTMINGHFPRISGSMVLIR